ncbi:MAG: pyrroloquinoline quinone-dependent dehydrogenase [Pseudomonadales bacterium]
MANPNFIACTAAEPRGVGARWPRSVGAVVGAVLLALGGCTPSFEPDPTAVARVRQLGHSWPEYGGGSGARYTPLAQIAPDNIAALEPAWTYRTGDVSDGNGRVPSTTAFENTPIAVDGRLFLCSPFNRVIALDPLTGAELWQYDPAIDLDGHYANQLICRGVAYWRGPVDDGRDCAARVFTATNDARLIALDAASGRPCTDFGSDGQIDLNPGVGKQEWRGEYQVTSPPTVVDGLVVVGSAVSDNERIDAPSGVVRAYDARTGVLRWAWDLAPPDFDRASGLVSDQGYALGSPNVWGPMVADADRDLLFVPTGNPAPDYYRPGTPDMDYYGTSVVALRASTGQVVWHFNTVHNDFWDLDVGSQPSLVDLTIDGRPVAALVQGTKTGFVFVLDRETGTPLIDVTEQPVPREGPLAAQLSPTQPYPPPAFRVADEVSADDAWGLTFWDKGQCRKLLESARTGPLYTPVTEQWTVVAPSNFGGINWGGVAVDPERGLIVARSNNVPFRVKLIARADFHGREGYDWDIELGPQYGVDYAMARQTLLSPLGLPCTAPPWGQVTAIDINARAQLWQVAHGTVRDIAPLPLPLALGVPGVGGPLITASGLVFLGGAWENALRAFDLSTGEVVWQSRLPASPQATPMSYSVREDDGSERQFVVIAAGGHGRMGSDLGDYLVAFALPR